MAKQKIFILTVVSLVSILSIITLFKYSKYVKQHANNFFREFPSHKLVGSRVIKKPSKVDFIAGFDGRSFYLGSRIEKNFLMKFQMETFDLVSMIVTAPNSLTVHEDARLLVDSANIYLNQGIDGKIMRGDLGNLMLKDNIKLKPFQSVLSFGNDSFIIRYLNAKRENALGIFDSKRQVLTEKPLLKKQVDGIFCTDGMLLKIPGGRIVYIYYYRNQFITMDSTLNVLYRGRTIDTNSRAKIKVSKINSAGEVSLASPPLYVNIEASANMDFLFVRSGLTADNEIKETSSTAAVIDVYRIQDGKYKFSFYLPDMKGQKLESFKVYGKTLVALYNEFIYTYKLKF